MHKKIVVFIIIALIAQSFFGVYQKDAKAVGTLKIGEYVQFGSYLNEPIVWKVIHFDEDGDPLLFSERILSMKAFDASGPKYSDQFVGMTGSNYWPHSTIRQWLNSDQTTINWMHNAPTSDNLSNPINAYHDEPGFLSDANFSADERDAIKTVQHNVLLGEMYKEKRNGGSEKFIYEENIELALQNYDSAYYQTISDKAFLLSLKELKEHVYDRGWAYTARPTEAAIINNEYLNGAYYTELWPYLLRTPDDSYYVRFVEGHAYSSKVTSNNPHIADAGVRPALYLDLSKIPLQSGDGTHNYPYKQDKVSIDLEPSTLVIRQGYSDTVPFVISSGQPEKVNWNSSNNQVAMVDPYGVITGVREGIATITAQTTSGLTDHVEIIVSSAPKAVQPIINKKTIKLDEISPSTLGNSYLTSISDLYGRTSEFFDHRGRLNIAVEGDKTLYIHGLDADLNIAKTVKIPFELSHFGAATADDKGNYYVMWGERYAREEDKGKTAILISKYSSTGEQINAVRYQAGDLDVKKAFWSGNAVLTISNNILAGYFGREMFKGRDGVNHQASTAVFVDAEKMKPVDWAKPYVSHSFDQQVIPLSSGGFLFADRGDAWSRGFEITKVNGKSDTGVTPFNFREGTRGSHGYNFTFSQLGGIAEGTEGYALVGASEKTLSAELAPSSRNESRNLFVQVIKKDMADYYIRSPEHAILTKGEKRTVSIKTERYDSNSKYFISNDTVNYGVKWLTSYQGNEDAANPKVIATDTGKFVVLWEHFENRKFKNAYFTVLSARGEVLVPATILKNTRLTLAEHPLYQEGKVYWTVSHAQELDVYVLDLDKTLRQIEVKSTSASVMVDGKVIPFESYNIGGSNYFKLRDIALALNKTNKSFEVGWDPKANTIRLTTGEAYTIQGGELVKPTENGWKNAALTNSSLYLDAEKKELTAFQIGGSNFFKLRDLAMILDFAVNWDGENNIVQIHTSEKYESP